MTTQKNEELNWMRLPLEYSNKENSQFVILPIAYEKDLTFGAGTCNGAKEIIKASEHLEYYDEEFDVEFFEKGIYTNPILKLSNESPKVMMQKVQEAIEQIDSSKFIIGLGGDHAVTIGLIKGLEKSTENTKNNGGPGFAVLQIDAHSDYRDSWNGSTLNHACVIRNIAGNHEIVQVGIRSQDKDERDALEKNENIQTIYAHNFSIEKVKEALSKIKAKNLYITIDVDGFDPSVISLTGTPEPGGLMWREVIEILKLCFEMKEVIGADIVEFAPDYQETNKQATNRTRIEAYTLARLVSKIISLVLVKN